MRSDPMKNLSISVPSVGGTHDGANEQRSWEVQGDEHAIKTAVTRELGGTASLVWEKGLMLMRMRIKHAYYHGYVDGWLEHNSNEKAHTKAAVRADEEYPSPYPSSAQTHALNEKGEILNYHDSY
jgi:hypothetical protein